MTPTAPERTRHGHGRGRGRGIGNGHGIGSGRGVGSGRGDGNGYGNGKPLGRGGAGCDAAAVVSKPRQAPVPAQRSDTLRKALLEELGGAALSARELAARVGLGEKEVVPHLEHLEKSLRARGERLIVKPARCLGCGHEFEDRRALTRPSRCPECRSERIEAPRFRVEISNQGR